MHHTLFTSVKNHLLSSSSSSMEKRKICRICDKSFANGRALGGHMRSHFAKLPLPPPRSASPVVESSAITRRSSDRKEHGASATSRISEEDAAQSLVDLSRDTWREREAGFACAECDKRFGSHQALGGHMASHKRTREPDDEAAAFRCEYCVREFGSRRALGGHKKAHFSTHLPKNAMSRSYGGSLVIDLFM